MGTCERHGCTRQAVAKGICRSHYNSERLAARRALERDKPRGCAECGKSLVGRRPNAMFCSGTCKYTAHDAARRAALADRLVGRVCVQCGTAIPDSAPSRAKTCSRACGVAYQNAVRAEAKRARWEATKPPCGNCGGEIPSDRHAGSKFCSPACKKQTQDARWRAKSPGYNRGRLYGVTPEQYAAMLAEQGNACAICKSTEWPGKGNRPQVDHDHVTGKVRGILCSHCNHGLGQFRDSPDLLQAAMAYLNR